MNQKNRQGRVGPALAAGVLVLVTATAVHAAEVVRHSLGPNNNFPIARAVEVPAGKTIIFHSGMTPAPADPKAAPGTPEYWGDTKTQALSAFGRIKESLDSLKLGFGDVVAMTVYLVGDPAKGGRMDFDGFMAAYTQFFGTKEQPNLPARSTVQVAGLVQPGIMVEIEVQLVK
ncbi:MAG TPA: RidA family protein [Steroidobacteraceae bacterium]|jgi:enamine deaminase RidA (YjgF/YER057c/UK114 family)|nr:RidA family protein [Steroidobacteraceae bacterium]